MPDDEKTKLLWWVIGAFLASVGVNQGIQKNFTVREDAFTGAEGDALEAVIETNKEYRIRNDNRINAKLESISSKIGKQEERIDIIEVFMGGVTSNLQHYVDREFTKERKDCSMYRNDIEKRLLHFEWLQQQVIATLKNYGISLTIRPIKEEP